MSYAPGFSLLDHLRVIRWTVICALLSWLGPSQAQSDASPVTVAVVEWAPVYQEVPLTGTVRTRRFSRLSPKVAGHIAVMHVDDGTRVEAGDPVLELDDGLATIGLEEAEAALAEGRARFAEAERRRDEGKELLAKKHIASTVYEESVAQVEIERAAVKRLEAAYRREQEILDYHVIRAPFAGVVGNKLVELGEWVETGTPVIELVELAIVRIEVPVPQQYFGQVDPGTPVEVRVDALPNRFIEAQVTATVPVSSTNARTFPIRIELENREGALAPGMSARVLLKLTTGDESEVLQLDRDAIVRRPDGSETVWKIEKNGDDALVTPVTVRVGRAFRNRVEILGETLAPGDRVVLHGNETLTPGQTVRIVEHGSETS